MKLLLILGLACFAAAKPLGLDSLTDEENLKKFVLGALDIDEKMSIHIAKRLYETKGPEALMDKLGEKMEGTFELFKEVVMQQLAEPGELDPKNEETLVDVWNAVWKLACGTVEMELGLGAECREAKKEIEDGMDEETFAEVLNAEEEDIEAFVKCLADPDAPECADSMEKRDVDASTVSKKTAKKAKKMAEKAEKKVDELVKKAKAKKAKKAKEDKDASGEKKDKKEKPDKVTRALRSLLDLAQA